MLDYSGIYFSDVEVKRETAVRLYQEFGQSLLALPEITDALDRLKLSSRDLTSRMAGMNMFSLCKRCGAQAGGGCCSAFMANETDAILLMINMLLGVRVSPQRDDSFECRYLGPEGCIFMVKPIFCLNYNCRHILDGNESHVLKDLELAAAAVLQEQVALEGRILSFIKQR